MVAFFGVLFSMMFGLGAPHMQVPTGNPVVKSGGPAPCTLASPRYPGGALGATSSAC